MTDATRDSGADAPPPVLRAALDALPAERTPPASAWDSLHAAMQVAEGPAAAARGAAASWRRRALVTAVTGVAALLLVLVTTQRVRGTAGHAAMPVAALLPDERSDPRVRAALDEARNWRAASADPVRAARWPVEARAAVDSALATSEQAIAVARASLVRDPANDAAKVALAALRAQQLALLQRAQSLLDDI
ncbi:MAG: hypothetical protein IT355_01930 [Gemmatimonadaceae bacterium]|nr:hypothetical protein [Gemmatimonadaceae bacterium]